MLAREVVRTLEEEGATVHAPTRRELDVTEQAALIAAFEDLEPEAVFHCAAYTDVDGAESNPAEPYAVNAVATARIARLCHDRDASLVYPSTDYVFSGEGSEPYRTDDPLSPLNVYGASKAAGECAVLAAPRGCVVRTSWLYGGGGANFVTSIVRKAREGGALRVVTDQIGRPTWTRQLARILVSLQAGGAQGMFHATGGGQPVSWHGFARAVLDHAGVGGEVVPVSSAEFGRAALRPAYSVLDCSETESRLGAIADWRADLAAFFASAGNGVDD